MILHFDIEADGLLEDVTQVFCVGTLVTTLADGDPGEFKMYTQDGPEGSRIEDFVDFLNNWNAVISGHNLIGYDLKVLKKLYKLEHKVFKIYDTLVMTGLVYPGDVLKQKDLRNPKVPGTLKGKRSLEAWGWRLGYPKGEHEDFDKLTPEMLVYCQRDVELQVKVFDFLMERVVDGELDEALCTETTFFGHLSDMIEAGVQVDPEALDDLIQVLVTAQAESADKLQEFFPPIPVEERLESLADFKARQAVSKNPSRLRRKVVQKAGMEVFNPNSRQQIVERLQMHHKWKHKDGEVTPNGQPKVDETILSALDYPCIPELVKYLMISKKLGQVATGTENWVDHMTKDFRIHGYINHNGAVTSRCTHSHPNLGQVPRVGKPFGKECRKVFVPKPGWLLTGCDAKGLELRMLAHFTYPFDGGDFRKLVLEGDPHTANMEALGIKDRDQAKTWFYAWLYGAQDGKLSKILGVSTKEASVMRKRFEKNVPGLQELRKSLEVQLVDNKMAHYVLKWGKPELVLHKDASILGLENRRIPCRSPHSLLNALNQHAGAILVKTATNEFHRIMLYSDLRKREDYNMVLHVHDEFQVEHNPGHAEVVRNSATAAFISAGYILHLDCPMDGDAKTGNNWSETH